MAAPTYFGSASTPADNGSNALGATTVTPPASMVDGDLVVVHCHGKPASVWSNTTTGGQTWNALAEYARISPVLEDQIFWCRFNGTWAADPVFTNTATSNNTVVMHVFRPDSGSKLWDIDVAQVSSEVDGDTTPTILGRNTVAADTVTLACWATGDDNTWGTLTGAGWVVTGVAQYRNLASTDSSSTFAHYLAAAAATAVPDVTKTQLTLGADSCLMAIITWKAYTAALSIDATIPALSSISPLLGRFGSAFSLMSATSSIVSDQGVSRALFGQISAAAIFSENLSVTGLYGSFAGASVISSEVGKLVSLVGIIPGVSAFAGMASSAGLYGSVGAAGQFQSSARIIDAFYSIVPAVSQFQSHAGVNRALFAQITSISAFSEAISVTGLYGSFAVVSVFSAAIGKIGSLSGIIPGVSAFAGLAGAAGLYGAINAAGQFQANQGIIGSTYAAITTTSQFQASLNAISGLVSSIPGTSAIQSLIGALGLMSSAASVSSFSGFNALYNSLHSAISAQSSIAGVISVGAGAIINIDGQIISVSSFSSFLGIVRELATQAVAQSAISGALGSAGLSSTVPAVGQIPGSIGAAGLSGIIPAAGQVPGSIGSTISISATIAGQSVFASFIFTHKFVKTISINNDVLWDAEVLHSSLYSVARQNNAIWAVEFSHSFLYSVSRTNASLYSVSIANE